MSTSSKISPESPKEDSENETAAHRLPFDRALEWAEDIRSRPLTDEQAINLAGVYAALAAVKAQEHIAEALEALGTPMQSHSTKAEKEQA